MAYTLFDQAKRYRNPLSAFYLRGIVTEDELFARIPFVGKDGDAFSYNREKTLGSAAFIAPNGSTSESSPTSDLVTVPKREIATDTDIPNFAIANQGGQGAVSDALQKKGKAVGRLLADKLISGAFVSSHTLGSSANPFGALATPVYGPWLDSRRFGAGELKYVNGTQTWSFRAPGDRDFGAGVAATTNGNYVLKSDNPSKWIQFAITVASATTDGRTSIEFTPSEQFDGLLSMVTPAQTRTPKVTTGDDLSFGILDELLDLVKVRSDLAFVMPAALRRKYKALYRGASGVAPTVMVGGFDQEGNPTERPALAYEGIPILKSDNIPVNEATGGSSADKSSIILVSLTAEEGFYVGAFGGSSENLDADPISRIVMGFQTIYVGQLEQKNMQRWRQVFYGGAALGSELAVARASGIKTL